MSSTPQSSSVLPVIHTSDTNFLLNKHCDWNVWDWTELDLVCTALASAARERIGTWCEREHMHGIVSERPVHAMQFVAQLSERNLTKTTMFSLASKSQGLVVQSERMMQNEYLGSRKRKPCKACLNDLCTQCRLWPSCVLITWQRRPCSVSPARNTF